MNHLSTLNKPWLHFIVLGLILHQMQSVFLPSPKPVIGPLSETRITALKELWTSSTGRAPSESQINGFIEAELDRDMLLQRALDLNFHLHDSIVYQRLIRNMKFLQWNEDLSDAELFAQAIEMQLHLDDEVVKRRLIQMMEQKLIADNPPPKPTEKDIADAFLAAKHSLRHPPLYSFEHVFFSMDRIQEVDDTIEKITQQALGAEQARQLGSPFLQGYRFSQKTPDQLTQNFGAGFVTALASNLNDEEGKHQQEQARWLGPIRSAYGVHYVWLFDFEPAREAKLEEVEPQLIRDMAYLAEKQALKCATLALRAAYDLQGISVETYQETVCN